MEREKIKHKDVSIRCSLHELHLNEEASLRKDHFHSEIELVFVKSGDMRAVVNGENLHISDGNILIISSRAVHKLMYGTIPSTIIYIQIEIAEILETIFTDYTLFSFFSDTALKKHAIVSSSSEIGRLFFLILNEMQEKKALYEMSIKGAVYQLTAYMCREGLIADEKAFFKNSAYSKIMPAINYARENYIQKISLDGLSAYLNIDKYNFCKQFKKITGTSYFDYIVYLRIKSAEQLLLTSDKNITEIAFACGFSTPQYFTRVFSKHIGYTPSVYRRMPGEK